MAKDRPKRPRAETPKGFRDYFGAEVRARAAMLARITEVYHAWGFEPLETSAVETVEALGKFLPDVDRPNQGVFAWQDEDDTWLALRYDLTAPLARVYAQHRAALPIPYRPYQVGPVWRDEKPGPGRFRQFYQCDADIVGAATVAADAEICAMLGEALEAAGIARGDYRIRVNNRKILDGVLETAGLYNGNDPEKYRKERGIVLRAIDKFDRVGEDGVRALLGAGRRDDSGDFTAGANLSEEQIARVLAFFSASSTKNIYDQDGVIDTVASGGILHTDQTFNLLSTLIETSLIGVSGLQEVRDMLALVGDSGVVFDTSVVRGLGYYTGPVFEAELTFEVLDDAGRPRQFGSVAGGGRYDDLVKRFTGETVPATGISVGVDRLLAALGEKGRLTARQPKLVVVTVMDRERMADYQKMAAELRHDLRDISVRAEVYLGGGGMGRQLKYADQRGAAIAVIQGADEHARDAVQLKDLALGARLAAEIETHEAWRAQPAQVEVPRGRLVAEVRAMLAR
jgi:histidyl-tRNA synthetase